MGDKRKSGARRRPACVWGGSALAAAGLCIALVAWVGLDRANSYLGVAASVAAVLGLALGVYGAVSQKGDAAGIRLDLRRIEVDGNNRTVGRVGKAGDADISVTISDAKISGNSTVIGETDGSVDFPDKA
jgi:hypothetical protein